MASILQMASFFACPHSNHYAITNSKKSALRWRLRVPNTVVYQHAENSAKIIKRVRAFAAAPPEMLESSLPGTSGSELEPVDPDFYRIGYIRYVRAFGVEFNEGPDGIGVYAARDVPHIRRPRVIMEVPMELMLTVSKQLPWIFFPDIVPIGHPIFDVINSTNPETDWDLRLACLLLLAFDQKDNFWQLYGDFLPSVEESTNLLLATEEELVELQDENLASIIKNQQQRARGFWKEHWHADVPLKLRRLAREPERFVWAVSIAQSRCITMTMTVGAKVQDANMLIPYADDIQLHEENAKRSIHGTIRIFISCGEAKIHLDSFLSAFNISGMPDEFYHNDALSDEEDTFVDGAILAAARTLPSWSEGDLPFLPSKEKRAVKELQEECCKMLGMFPTTFDEDLKILESDLCSRSKIYEAAIKGYCFEYFKFPVLAIHMLGCNVAREIMVNAYCMLIFKVIWKAELDTYWIPMLSTKKGRVEPIDLIISREE